MTFESELLAARPYVHKQAIKYTRDIDRAEDLASDTVLRAMKYKDSYTLDTNIRGWLGIIMRSLFLSQVRRKKLFAGSTDDIPIDLLGSIPGSQEAAVNLSDAGRMLEQISPLQRQAVLLIGMGASYEEAADQIGCKLGTVKTRVMRGREALRKAIEG